MSVPDAATNSFITWYEDLTNVHIEWEHAPGDGGSEKRSLLLASGDYPEIFISEVNMRKEEELRYGTQGVSRPREPPPQALAEPYVNVSAHTAPIIRPSVEHPTDTSGQTTGALDEQLGRANIRRAGDAV